MALNSSGPISLAGPISGQSIALTILQSPTGQISLNDTDVRTLSGVTTPNSQITMPGNFWGKAWHASTVDFFMMGGGGADGPSFSGGAGGGQMVGQNGQNVSVTTGVTYIITVGGAGSVSNAFGYTAIAGGGGSGGSAGCTNGGSGACGQGATVSLTPAYTCSPGSGSAGGSGGNSYSCCGSQANDASTGGGGGLGGTGGSASSNRGGNGGASLISTFTGSAVPYGGGKPGQTIVCGNTGPCQFPSWYDSGYGPNTGYGSYSGIVIIRVSDQVLQPTTTGSPNVTQYNGYYWYKFTGSGTITF